MHKYSDNCVCQECERTFQKAVMAAMDRPKKRKKGKK